MHFKNAHRRFEVWEKEQLLRRTAYSVVKERKDYKSAVKLMQEALKLIKSGPEDIWFTSKIDKLDSCYRLLTMYSLKLPNLKLALKYGKLYEHPGYLGDICFELSDFKSCLDNYSVLGTRRAIYLSKSIVTAGDERISPARIPKVVKAFFGLIINQKSTFGETEIKIEFEWLYKQVIDRFITLDNAFQYYNCGKKLPTKKMIKRQEGFTDDEIQGKIDLAITEKFVAEVIETNFDTIAKYIKNQNLNRALNELLSLFDKAKKHESHLGQLRGMVALSLITNISDLYLLLKKPQEAVLFTSKYFDQYWRLVDYFLNLKFMTGTDIAGEEIVKIGHSESFRLEANVDYPQFYSPTPFSGRHKSEMARVCEDILDKFRRNHDCRYLDYIYQKYVDEKTPLETDDTGSNNPPNGTRNNKVILDRYCHPLLGGPYGPFELSNLYRLLKLLDLPSNLNRDNEWIHISFSSCSELVRFVSQLNFDAENVVRIENDIPERGRGWKSENEIYAFVKKSLFPNLKVKQHYCPEWLKPRHFDVFVPKLNFAIEYQGKQHFEPVEVFGGEETFQRTQVRDKIKYNLCKRNNVKLLYIHYDDDNPEETIVSFINRQFGTNLLKSE